MLSESRKDLEDKMTKFIFPPRYDWYNNPEPAISPFVMFAFEFKHFFTRQELADIWQGVMPEASTKVVSEISTLNIPVTPAQMMGPFLSTISNSETSNETITEVMKELRWMVFKTKQRARNVYANVTEDLTDNVAGSFFGTGELFVERDERYSYNWPYDFCSLVELSKIETEIEIK